MAYADGGKEGVEVHATVMYLVTEEHIFEGRWVDWCRGHGGLRGCSRG
jgi:hypothetical protein